MGADAADERLPVGQTLPHAPQLFESLDKFLQTPLQLTWEGVQMGHCEPASKMTWPPLLSVVLLPVIEPCTTESTSTFAVGA